MSTPNPAFGLTGITLDCLDVAVVSSFWSALLGLPLRESLPGWKRIGPLSEDGPVLTMQPVPEEKRGKTRLHLDLSTDDVEAAADRVRRLGGHGPSERHDYDEGVVVVMADPEGTEFCLVQYYPGYSPT